MRTMLKSKIHRATVTEANVDYEGSITVDSALLEAADILPYELVHVLDIENGIRLETYAIAGPPNTGVVCINGAAARLVHRGDLVIILAYRVLANDRARHWKPKLVYVDSNNRITHLGEQIAVPKVVAHALA
jgi:aspartate 1-decarboxylase